MASKKRKQEVDITKKFLTPVRSFQIKDIKLTERQREFVGLFKDPNTSIIFLSGPSGSAKSFMSLFCGLLAVREGAADTVKYLRSLTESSDSKCGFLPGSLFEKTQPFCEALQNKMEEMLSEADSEYLTKEGAIQSLSTNFLRGVTFKDSVVIADESQNNSFKCLTTIISRIGENTKIIFCYDPLQSDIKNSGICQMQKIFDDEQSRANGICSFKFTSEDILRHPKLAFIMNRIENSKS